MKQAYHNSFKLSYILLCSTRYCYLIVNYCIFLQASKLIAKSGNFANTTEVLNVLARMKNIARISDDHILSAAELLDRAIKEGEDGSEESALSAILQQNSCGSFHHRLTEFDTVRC